MAERSSELGETIPVEKIDDSIGSTVGAADDNLDTARAVDNSLISTDSFDDADTDSEDDATPETEELRSQIEDTRSQMSETIDAIQEKLSFSHISEQVKDEVSEHINSAIKTAKESVYEATLGKMGNVMNYINKGMNEMADTDVVRVAGKNPLALTLIGLGLGLLAMNGFSKKQSKSYRYKNNYNYDRDSDSEQRNFSSGNSQSTIAAAQSKVTDAAGKVGETVSGAAGVVSGTVSDVAGKAYEQVGNVGSQAKKIAGSAQNQYEYYIEENPLAVGAVALALGAAVGMSIPSTRVEGELMGETRDNLIEKAQVTARDTLGKVQHVAGSMTETVKQAAGNIVDTVKESAGEVAQTVKDDAKNQGLT